MWVRNAESNRPERALVSVSSVIRARGKLIVVEAWILVAVVGRPLRQRRRRHDHHQCDSAEYRFHLRFSLSPRASTDPPDVGFRRLGAMQFCNAGKREGPISSAKRERGD